MVALHAHPIAQNRAARDRLEGSTAMIATVFPRLRISGRERIHERTLACAGRTRNADDEPVAFRRASEKFESFRTRRFRLAWRVARVRPR